MARSKFKSRTTANENAIELHGIKKEPEQKLWIAVVAKALDDALYQNDLNPAREAISWVKSCGHNFKYVCHLAGYNWQYVYEKVIKKVEKREKDIDDYVNGIKNLQTINLARKWYVMRMNSKVIRVYKGGRPAGVPRKGGKHGRKWNYIVAPSKTN